MSLEKRKKIILFTSVFFISFFICSMVTGIYIHTRSRLESIEMEQLAINKANKVSSVLTELLYKTQILAAFVQQNDGNIDDFNTIASIVVDSPSIRNVILAPDGIVKDVYPLEGNESVIGLDYFSESEGNKEAIQAKETGELVMGGPFTLLQGGQAIVGRLPVTLIQNGQPEFWGIVSITLHYPQSLELAELEQLQSRGFAYELWRISPDTGEHQIITQCGYEYNENAKYVEHSIQILNADWYFRLSPIRSWWQFPETWICVLLSFLISFLAGFLVLKNYDLNLIKNNLELITYIDDLTGIYNRNGIFKILQEMIAEKHPFVLSYIDLNKFKSVNDSFGHAYGDKVLKYFTAFLSSRLDEEVHFFGRIGGDEFILIFKGEEHPAQAQTFFETAEAALLKEYLYYENQKIEISYSVGFSSFPKDGHSIDKLISIADMNMYIFKRKTQCT